MGIFCSTQSATLLGLQSYFLLPDTWGLAFLIYVNICSQGKRSGVGCEKREGWRPANRGGDLEGAWERNWKQDQTFGEQEAGRHRDKKQEVGKRKHALSHASLRGSWRTESRKETQPGAWGWKEEAENKGENTQVQKCSPRVNLQTGVQRVKGGEICNEVIPHFPES